MLNVITIIPMLWETYIKPYACLYNTIDHIITRFWLQEYLRKEGHFEDMNNGTNWAQGTVCTWGVGELYKSYGEAREISEKL